MTHLPARAAASSLRQRAFSLLLISLMTAGLLSAPTPAVAATQTISGAVVALELPVGGGYLDSYEVSPPWEGGECRFTSYSYRLKCMTALYLPGFGSENVEASITKDGGCAIKQSGDTWCYGRSGMAGDSTMRIRPLPVRSTHDYIQLANVAQREDQPTATWRSNPGGANSADGYYADEKGRNEDISVLCGLTSSNESGEVFCWGPDVAGTSSTPFSLGTGFTSISPSGALHQDGSIYIFARNPPNYNLELQKVSLGLLGHISNSSDRVVLLPLMTGIEESAFAWSTYDPEIDPPEVNPETYWRNTSYVSWEGRGGAVCLVLESGANHCGRVVPFPLWRSIGGVVFDPQMSSLGLLGLSDLNGSDLGADQHLSEDSSLLPEGITSLMDAGSFGTTCGRIANTYRCANTYSGTFGDATGHVSGQSRSMEGNPEGSLGDLVGTLAINFFSPHWGEDPAQDQPFPSEYEKLVGTDIWWCALGTVSASCAPTRYEQGGFGPNRPGVLDYFDQNDDGSLAIGTEIPLACGVGFQCSFDPDTMVLNTSVLTMTGTLTRTPRASVNLSGILRLSDGQPAAGQMEWRSSDGLLRSSIVIAVGGRFSLPARTGAGTVSYLPYTRVGNTMGGPAVCPAIGTPGTWGSGCTTGYGTVAFANNFTASLSGLDLTLPTFAGEQRTLRLQFGDETTGILGARLAMADSGPNATCEISTTTLGVLRACFSFSFNGVFENGSYGPTANSAGEITLYSPTESDIEYEISTTASDGIQWSDRRVSFRDDGATPDAWVFPGLIFAATPSNMTMARGGSMQVASSVSVDGLDPAFGLAARLVPLSGQVKACSSEAVTSESDAEGDLAFRVCPGATGSWRIVSADGSFFPSAPFTISVPKMVAGITLKGAKLSSRFNPAVSSTYSGAFTSSTATFAVTLTKAAKKAVVSAAKCTRPTSGARTCKVTVKLNGTVETYTFVLNRK